MADAQDIYIYTYIYMSVCISNKVMWAYLNASTSIEDTREWSISTIHSNAGKHWMGLKYNNNGCR